MELLSCSHLGLRFGAESRPGCLLGDQWSICNVLRFGIDHRAVLRGHYELPHLGGLKSERYKPRFTFVLFIPFLSDRREF